LPELAADGVLGLDLEDRPEAAARVEADGRVAAGRSRLPEGGWLRVPLDDQAGPPHVVVLETRSDRAFVALGFGFVRVRPGTPPLPRHRALP
jgi:hypothetical protein